MDLKLIIFALAAAALVANTVGSKEKLPQHTLQSGKVAQYEVLGPDRYKVIDWVELTQGERTEMKELLADGCKIQHERVPPSMYEYFVKNFMPKSDDRIFLRVCSRPVTLLV